MSLFRRDHAENGARSTHRLSAEAYQVGTSQMSGSFFLHNGRSDIVTTSQWSVLGRDTDQRSSKHGGFTKRYFYYQEYPLCSSIYPRAILDTPDPHLLSVTTSRTTSKTAQARFRIISLCPSHDHVQPQLSHLFPKEIPSKELQSLRFL